MMQTLVWKRLGIIVLLVVAVASLLFTPGIFRVAQAEAETITTSEILPLPESGRFHFVPCAAGGAGEVVVLDGYIHSTNHTTLDGNGGFLVRGMFNLQDITGIGQTTGAVYRATGGLGSVSYSGGAGAVDSTFIGNFNLISQGAAPNAVVHITIHTTVNANGIPTSTVTNVVMTCQ